MERDSKRRRATLRGIAIVGHRYVGLAMAVFLIVAGLTGSLIAFDHELDAFLNPTLFKAEAPSPASEPLEPLVLRERLLASLPPEAHVNYVPLGHTEGESASFWVRGPEDTTEEYFLDPYTGEILGSRRYADIRQGLRNLMPFIYRLHYSLALGTVGSYLFGVVALLWTLDCFVGAYLTFPPRHRDGSRRRSSRSWLRRWKSSWLLRTNKLFSFVFTWHRASGLWVWAMLFVFAWSAVALNLREVYHPVMKAAFDMPERAYERFSKLDEPQPDPALSWTDALAKGRSLMAQEAARRGLEIHGERRIGYDADRGAFRYAVRSSRDISDRYPSTTVWFDGDRGDLLAFEAPTGENTGATITTWLYHLHFGSIAVGGWPYRIFVCLMGLGVTLLSATGVWIWWRKRTKRSARAAPERASNASVDMLGGPESTAARVGRTGSGHP